MHRYIGLIHKDEGTDYGVSFPDFPGCISAGETLDDARLMAQDALSLHVGGMVEDGEPLPEPSTLEAVMAEPDHRGGVAILVDVPSRSAKTVRVNVTFPQDALDAIDNYAERHGFTRSGFLLRAAKRAMTDAPA